MSKYDSIKEQSETILALLKERDQLIGNLSWLTKEIHTSKILHKQTLGGIEQACDSADMLLTLLVNELT